jgi:plasmid stabilization system protein ParE
VPHVAISQNALLAIKRCVLFLKTSNPRAAKQSHSKIMNSFRSLEKQHELGRPCEYDPLLRELIIDFSNSGYIALYKIDLAINTVFILAFRHQQEAGY